MDYTKASAVETVPFIDLSPLDGKDMTNSFQNEELGYQTQVNKHPILPNMYTALVMWSIEISIEGTRLFSAKYGRNAVISCKDQDKDKPCVFKYVRESFTEFLDRFNKKELKDAPIKISDTDDEIIEKIADDLISQMTS